MKKTEKQIRRWINLLMLVLFLSGLTALPLETELRLLTGIFPSDSLIGGWFDKVYNGLVETNKNYPFLAYGYDWLAFAHFVLALLFIGPLRNPVKNKWVIEFGMIACFLIIPFALVAVHYRDIPSWWRLIDCSFGVIGLVPLSICLRKINQMEINKAGVS